ncbi:beta-lactamase family protein [Nocardioides sp. zg-536]|uniref:Beta-lactamase family protein n=1 Tax=Nocardioides faecalis TaxID=2803858 RepID=A0A939BWK0_9ACTN|nr:serine hydrolase domain-containing protein [Nocardioides faecalis]MBM9458443.1 beta-lactamase family protein [Nocardioides faecalis]QVI58457.1 beta-lactamase family protein [Nocardioides faecalis]
MHRSPSPTRARRASRALVGVTAAVALIAGLGTGPQAAAGVRDDVAALRAEAKALTVKSETQKKVAAASTRTADRAEAKAEVFTAQAKKAAKSAKKTSAAVKRAKKKGLKAKVKALRAKVASQRKIAKSRSQAAAKQRAAVRSAKAAAARSTERADAYAAQAQTKATEADLLALRADREESLAEILEGWNIPGAQIVYSKNGVTDSYSFGVQSTATNVPVTNHSIFQGASLSKVVSSYVFLKRVDEGVIDLDTPLWEYYESPRTAHSDDAKTITARMVLNHTTGLPNWANGAGNESSLLTPAFTPGTDWGYSGDGFFLLQQTIEHLDGQLFHETLKEEVFEPFGMNDSTLVTLAENADRTIVGHDAAGVPVAMSNWQRGNSAYTLQTTAEDYTRFIQHALIDGEGLEPETHTLWTEYSADADRDADNPANPFISWGLGVGLQESSKGKALWHWGDNTTRKAFFLAFPDRDESVAIFWNSANGQASAGQILSTFLGAQQFHALTWVG